MIDSIRQICRTPIKLMILILSMIISTMILVVGSVLLLQTNRKLDELEESYTTIGMVEQKKSSMEMGAIWDAADKSYMNYSSEVYEKILDDNILDFAGSDYIAGPEKRPYYGAYMPDYLKSTEAQPSFFSPYLVIEFTPVETCMPNRPVLVHIENVLWGDVHNSSQLWLCDHHTEHPDILEAGKKYIAVLMYRENTHGESQIGTTVEWYPVKLLGSTQCDKNGNVYPSFLDDKKEKSWEEVTYDFYESGNGRYWLNMIESFKKLEETIPILPTNSLTLLPSFHSKKAEIISGRKISDQEFKSGQRVCLVSKEFADMNGLKSGDKISLPLYFADYNNPSSQTFGRAIGFSLLDAQGNGYAIFSEHEYEIVGMYQYQVSEDLALSELSSDQIIIPFKSVEESDANNIVDVGPMRRTTSSFQIQNGKIEEYKMMFSKVSNNNFLEIYFDDNGYANMKKELDENRIISYMLCSAGLLSSITLILLLLYFFIIKNKKRIAIERAMGASKNQCRLSMLGGLIIFVFAAVILGSIAGNVLIKYRTDNPTEKRQEGYFSTKYSSRQEIAGQVTEDKSDISSLEIIEVSIGIPVILILFVILISYCFVEQQFKEELVMLLGDREE